MIGFPRQKVLAIRRQAEAGASLCLFSFSNIKEEVALSLPRGDWEKLLDSSSQQWQGTGEVAPGRLAATDPAGECAVVINPYNVLVYAGSNIGG